jgi:hypothetical protein
MQVSAVFARFIEIMSQHHQFGECFVESRMGRYNPSLVLFTLKLPFVLCSAVKSVNKTSAKSENIKKMMELEQQIEGNNVSINSKCFIEADHPKSNRNPQPHKLRMNAILALRACHKLTSF